MAALTIASGESPVPTSRLGTVAAIERVLLPARTPEFALDVDPLGFRITLRGIRDARGLAKAMEPQMGRLCPKVAPQGQDVVLTCPSNRLDALIVSEGGKRYLELHELRGLPWRGPANNIGFDYDPHYLRLGGDCPGTTPVARGECALMAGRVADAATQFRLALDGEFKSMAALRLGDIALRRGDVALAASWYQRAIGTSIFGRMANAKLCELSGSCFSSPRLVFDPIGMPEPLHTELLLRSARFDAYMGRPFDAAKKIALVLPPVGRTGACIDVGQEYCRRLLLDALERAAPKGRDDESVTVMEIYLALPDRSQGPLALELSRAAAEASARMGAPVFAGNLMSASVPLVSEAQLGEHLLRTADLYLNGHDRPRARVILEFAETRLHPREMFNRRWLDIRRECRRTPTDPQTDPKVLSEVELLLTEGAADLAGAYRALVKSRMEAR